MTYEIEFYISESNRSPVEDFIFSLPRQEQSKIGHLIDLLEQFGPLLKMPNSRPIVGYDNLFELRTSGKNAQRIFYFHFTGKTYVLLHGFTKKDRKTPKKEIDTALYRRNDYLKNMED